jgi:imidazolonepropionase-like amidohydrolase
VVVLQSGIKIMKTSLELIQGAAYVAALWALAANVAGAQTSKSLKVVDEGVVIEDVTVISPERQAPLPHATVVLREGHIAEIGTNLVAGPHAKRMEGHDRFLIPGLIDSHVHLDALAPLDDDAVEAHPELLQAYRSQLPRSYLAFGFTTLVDLTTAAQTLARFNDAPVHPNLLHCGPAVRTAGGYGALRIPKDAAPNTINLVYEATEAKDWPANLDPHDYTPARAVERVAEGGGVCVKAFVESGFGGVFHWPVPSAETLAALRAETRRRGLVFIVHANAVEAWRAAIDAHADVIAHGLWHWPGDRFSSVPPTEARDVIHAAANSGIGVQPTLQVLYGELTVFDRSLLDNPRLAEALPKTVIAYLKSDASQASARATADTYRQIIAKLHPPASMDSAAVMDIAPARATATLRIMREENVKLLFGSDTPSSENIGNPPGLNGRFELSRWKEAGVPLSQILRSATLDNAVAFGLSADRGTIEVGKRADLLLLRADPLKTIEAYDAIETVFVNGNPIPRASLLPVN